MGDPQFTDKELAFIHWYCILLNATEAAARAGYGDEDTTRTCLSVIGAENIAKPRIRTEIDRRLKASIPSADEVLQRISQRAMVDVTPYLKDDQTLDVPRLANDGLGHLVTGVKRTREGPEVTLTDPQTATKTLARYHRLLGEQVDVTIQDRTTPNRDVLDSLAEQVRVLRQAVDSGVGDGDSKGD